MLKDEVVELDFAKGESDLLGQFAAVDTLLSTVEGLPPPACVALYGAWGSGKTTVMHNAMRRCSERLWIPVWFAPWEYDRQPDLLQPLLRALLLEVRKRKGEDPDRWKAFKKQATAAFTALAGLSIRVGFRTLLNATLGPVGEQAPVTARDMSAFDVERWLDGDDEPPDEVAAVKQRFKALVDAALALASKDGVAPDDARVVFFLDDLDRCLPDQVVELIEGVKLLLCGATGCRAVFVFALDRQIVGEAIRHRFPGSTLYTGENYLEKIFDFSLEAPPVPLAGSAADEVSPGSLQRFVEQVARGLPRTLDAICQPFGGTSQLYRALALPAFANPRVIKRTLNRLHLLTSVESRQAALAEMGDHETYHRYFVWVAGAERFRQFRHFIRRASRGELDALLSMTRDEPRGWRSPEIEQLAAAPGFRDYIRSLGLRTPNPAVPEMEAWSSYDPKRHKHTLRWLDDSMRSAGV
ncbi:MAG: P-loop NTPase fold protein [bacterium]